MHHARPHASPFLRMHVPRLVDTDYGFETVLDDDTEEKKVEVEFDDNLVSVNPNAKDEGVRVQQVDDA
eukprot:COSAG02_NODE_1153_length_14196_cov_3.626658_4_plen_68_part_00